MVVIDLSASGPVARGSTAVSLGAIEHCMRIPGVPRVLIAILALLGSACAFVLTSPPPKDTGPNYRNDFSITVLPGSSYHPIYRFETVFGAEDSVRIAHFHVHPCGDRPFGVAFDYFPPPDRPPGFLRELRQERPPDYRPSTKHSDIPFEAGCWYAMGFTPDDRMAIAFLTVDDQGVVRPFSRAANDSAIRVRNLAGKPIVSRDTVLSAWAATLGFISRTRDTAASRPWLIGVWDAIGYPFPPDWIDSLVAAQVIGGYCQERCPDHDPSGMYLMLHPPVRGYVDTIWVDVTFDEEPGYCDLHPGSWVSSTQVSYDVIPSPEGLSALLSTRWPMHFDGICRLADGA
jgi:hypothetical protein